MGLRIHQLECIKKINEHFENNIENNIEINRCFYIHAIKNTF